MGVSLPHNGQKGPMEAPMDFQVDFMGVGTVATSEMKTSDPLPSKAQWIIGMIGRCGIIGGFPS